ncbi:hypothetical protein QUB60_12640 [Microcoleus sp. A2-C5]|uniref:hypothetical protein n=1 Tax=Microcoleaceae TaxID=1892252 RepID=UPI002236FE2E|nr:hypothetical protein [Lyngbya sp. CCAP 1446/10]
MKYINWEHLISEKSIFYYSAIGTLASLAPIALLNARLSLGCLWLVFTRDCYPKITAWCDPLLARPSWQQTQVTEADMAAFAARRQSFLAQSEV